ncbi:MAG: polysaccharide biosynthesis tyrosine autokinase, partial [Candidatus Entotheonellia bacterium]
MIKNKNFQYLSQVINSGMIQQLKVRLDTLEAERARLSTLFTADHPRVLELSQQITEAQRRLSIELGNVVRGVESDYTAARVKEESLQAESQRQQQAALNLKELGAEYTVLQGEVEANRAVYDGVLRRLNETNVSKDTPLSNIQITEGAELPLVPSSPQTRRNLLFASVLGLFLGVGLAFVLELLDSTVQTPEDVWRAVAVPTLGVVPHLSSLRHRIYGYNHLPVSSPLSRLSHASVTERDTFPLELMVAHHPLSLIAEAYRTLRTVLLLTPAENPPQVILFTSAHPGDGKTSTALNLAITLAQAGRRVVVVDGDLRKGNCHRLLHMQSRPGLCDIVRGEVALEDGVQQTGVAGLSFISRGPVPPDPSYILGSEKMKEVVQALRQRFDFVLIDTPPAIAVSDAAVVSVLCDGVLLVLRG